uniref:SJCHGC01358 protein n=1 Tax=Schistosoma japonicum TaxID=6182 RepID=Q5DEH1_SCHJA|nr:SJCHGC01358 protein [Schistosoma japonicum]
MNLYCIIRIGDARFETQTSSRSGKHPIWNETFRCWLHDGVDKLSLEIVSENIFSSSQVAHAVIAFPRSLYDGIALNQWFELSGQQGENLEGSINLIFQCRKVPVNLPLLQSTPLYCQPRLGVVGDMQVLPKPISTEEVQSIHEIFPSVEEDTIRSLLATHHGNREIVISELLLWHRKLEIVCSDCDVFKSFSNNVIFLFICYWNDFSSEQRFPLTALTCYYPVLLQPPLSNFLTKIKQRYDHFYTDFI